MSCPEPHKPPLAGVLISREDLGASIPARSFAKECCRNPQVFSNSPRWSKGLSDARRPLPAFTSEFGDRFHRCIGPSAPGPGNREVDIFCRSTSSHRDGQMNVSRAYGQICSGSQLLPSRLCGRLIRLCPTQKRYPLFCRQPQFLCERLPPRRIRRRPGLTFALSYYSRSAIDRVNGTPSTGCGSPYRRCPIKRHL